MIHKNRKWPRKQGSSAKRKPIFVSLVLLLNSMQHQCASGADLSKLPLQTQSIVKGEIRGKFEIIDESYLGAKWIKWSQALKVLHISGDMDIDADGSPNALQLDPMYGQLSTSYTFPGERGQRRFLDSEKVPYYVLPGRKESALYKRFGVKLGDIAVISYKDTYCYAIYGDVGPSKKFGEASLLVADQLGFNPYSSVRGKRRVTRGISEGVSYLIFPNSAVKNLTPEDARDKIEKAGLQLLKKLNEPQQ
jgi:hypothetical protein